MSPKKFDKKEQKKQTSVEKDADEVVKTVQPATTADGAELATVPAGRPVVKKIL